MLYRGEKGFTLIELLVVIAILGVIAAVVALSVAGFFGRGTFQAANTELHQAQTAIIAAMADAETNILVYTPEGDWPDDGSGVIEWSGEADTIVIEGTDGVPRDASTYVYGLFRATYKVDETGAIIDGCADGSDDPICDFCSEDVNPWGPTIVWGDNNSWEEKP